MRATYAVQSEGLEGLLWSALAKANGGFAQIKTFRPQCSIVQFELAAAVRSVAACSGEGSRYTSRDGPQRTFELGKFEQVIFPKAAVRTERSILG